MNLNNPRFHIRCPDVMNTALAEVLAFYKIQQASVFRTGMKTKVLLETQVSLYQLGEGDFSRGIVDVIVKTPLNRLLLFSQLLQVGGIHRLALSSGVGIRYW